MLRKNAWIVALFAALAIVLMGCPPGDKGGDLGPVGVIYEMSNDSEIQGKADGAQVGNGTTWFKRSGSAVGTFKDGSSIAEAGNIFIEVSGRSAETWHSYDIKSPKDGNSNWSNKRNHSVTVIGRTYDAAGTTPTQSSLWLEGTENPWTRYYPEGVTAEPGLATEADGTFEYYIELTWAEIIRFNGIRIIMPLNITYHIYDVIIEALEGEAAEDCDCGCFFDGCQDCDCDEDGCCVECEDLCGDCGKCECKCGCADLFDIDAIAGGGTIGGAGDNAPSWNNTTKVMTVTASTSTLWYITFADYGYTWKADDTITITYALVLDNGIAAVIMKQGANNWATDLSSGQYKNLDAGPSSTLVLNSNVFTTNRNGISFQVNNGDSPGAVYRVKVLSVVGELPDEGWDDFQGTAVLTISDGAQADLSIGKGYITGDDFAKVMGAEAPARLEITVAAVGGNVASGWAGKLCLDPNDGGNQYPIDAPAITQDEDTVVTIIVDAAFKAHFESNLGIFINVFGTNATVTDITLVANDD